MCIHTFTLRMTSMLCWISCFAASLEVERVDLRIAKFRFSRYSQPYNLITRLADKQAEQRQLTNSQYFILNSSRIFPTKERSIDELLMK